MRAVVLIRSAALVAMLLAMPALHAFAAARPTVAQVTEGLTCQCGCGLTVANCNHPQCSFSVPLRADVEKMIGRGMSRAQIIGFYRTRYGEKVLSAPTTEGFNLLAWITPFAAILLGGMLIAYAFSRWRGAPAPAHEGGSRTRTDFDPEMLKRLEAEIEESR